MKTTVSIVVLCAFAAIAYATPLPQGGEAPAAVAATADAPSRPLFSAISSAAETANAAFSGLAMTGFNVAKSVAENTGKMIDNTAIGVTNGINSAAQTISATITRPFQSAQASA